MKRMARRLIDRLAFKHPRMGLAELHAKGWVTKRGKITKAGIKEAKKYKK